MLKAIRGNYLSLHAGLELDRQESRGAQQREDFPGMLENWTVNQVIRLNNDELQLQRSALVEAP